MEPDREDTFRERARPSPSRRSPPVKPPPFYEWGPAEDHHPRDHHQHHHPEEDPRGARGRLMGARQLAQLEARGDPRPLPPLTPSEIQDFTGYSGYSRDRRRPPPRDYDVYPEGRRFAPEWRDLDRRDYDWRRSRERDRELDVYEKRRRDYYRYEDYYDWRRDRDRMERPLRGAIPPPARYEDGYDDYDRRYTPRYDEYDRGYGRPRSHDRYRYD